MKGNEDFPSRSIVFDSLWIIQETKKINSGLGLKLNKPSSLYHHIRSFINLRQGENNPYDNFKLRWDNVYETMEIAGEEKILRSDQLVKVAGYKASSKEKEFQVDEMNAMCFILSADQKRHSLLLK